MVLTEAVAKRDQVRWIIATLHKPLYCSVDGSPSFKDELEANSSCERWYCDSSSSSILSTN
jgi:hypothetical protein